MIIVDRLPIFQLEEYFRRYSFQPGMVNLSASNPISPTIGEVLELAGLPLSALKAVSLDYSETAGARQLRQAVAELYDDLDAAQVIVTNGAVEAIAIGLAALVEPGTRVVLENPIYGSYEPLLRLLGAEVTLYELAAGESFEYDFGRLEALVASSRSELVIVNPYNNPTGRGLTSASALEALCDLSGRLGCKVVCDEVFRHASLEGEPLPSALDITDTAVAVGDMTKAWGLGGLRIGWLASRDTALLERALTTRDFTTNSNSSVSEVLAELALSVRGQLLEAALSRARDTFAVLDAFIAGSRGALSWFPPMGGYCGFIEVHGTPVKAVPQLCAELAESQSYLLLPGAVFGPQWDRFLRVGLAAGGERLAAGLGAFLEVAGLA